MSEVMETKEYHGAFVEKLKDGSTRVYNKDKIGRINNDQYYNDHKEDFLQPRGSMAKDFERLYGKSKT